MRASVSKLSPPMRKILGVSVRMCMLARRGIKSMIIGCMMADLNKISRFRGISVGECGVLWLFFCDQVCCSPD